MKTACSTIFSASWYVLLASIFLTVAVQGAMATPSLEGLVVTTEVNFHAEGRPDMVGKIAGNIVTARFLSDKAAFVGLLHHPITQNLVASICQNLDEGAKKLGLKIVISVPSQDVRAGVLQVLITADPVRIAESRGIQMGQLDLGDGTVIHAATLEPSGLASATAKGVSDTGPVIETAPSPDGTKLSSAETSISPVTLMARAMAP